MNQRMLIFTDHGEVVDEDGKVSGWNRIHMMDVRNPSSKNIWTVLEAGRDSKLRALYANTS